MKKPRPTSAQKTQAILLYLSGGKRVDEVAFEMGVSVSTVYRWKAEYEKKKLDQLEKDRFNLPLKTRVERLEAELDAFQNEVVKLILMNNIIKRALISNTKSSDNEILRWFQEVNEEASSTED